MEVIQLSSAGFQYAQLPDGRIAIVFDPKAKALHPSGSAKSDIVAEVVGFGEVLPGGVRFQGKVYRPKTATAATLPSIDSLAK